MINQDDVAAMVAHDAAVGLPGFTRVEPERNTLAWAESVIRRNLTPAVRAAAGAGMLALARSVENYGPQATADQLNAGAADELLDRTHGEGTADLVDALLSWWRDLTEGGRARSGVSLLPFEDAGPPDLTYAEIKAVAAGTDPAGKYDTYDYTSDRELGSLREVTEANAQPLHHAQP